MTSAFMERQNQIENVEIKQTLTDASESHEGGSVLGCSDLKVTLLVLQATSQERASQNEKQV
jgi:hypothetical protein